MATDKVNTLVGILMGSKSDWEIMQHCAAQLEALKVPWEAQAISAHRAPDALFEYLSTAIARGLEVIIAAAGGAAQVGKPAPDFTVTDINGKTHKLSDYEGKIVVLESYNQDCPFYHNHYQTGAMQELQKWATSKGVVWLLVDSAVKHSGSYRAPATAKKEWNESKINATAWIDDHDGKLGRLFGMRTTPDMFVIDKNGVLVYSGAIDDRAEPEGDPRTAHNYVREAINKLMSGEKPEVTETKPYGCGVKYAT
jgi:peroxiredoxin